MDVHGGFKGPALLQLASSKFVYLVDLITLGKSAYLNEVLARIFSDTQVVVLGFDF